MCALARPHATEFAASVNPPKRRLRLTEFAAATYGTRGPGRSFGSPASHTTQKHQYNQCVTGIVC